MNNNFLKNIFLMPKSRYYIILFISLFYLNVDSDIYAQARIIINNTSPVYMVMNGGTVTSPVYLSVDNTATNAITMTNTPSKEIPTVSNPGWIVSEWDGNFIQWKVTGGSTYTFPFGTTTTVAMDSLGTDATTLAYIPFSFTPANSITMSVSTYGTGANNTPWANTIANMNSAYGGSATGSVIDRWWRVNATGAGNSNMSMSYRGSENTTTTTPTDVTWAQEWDNNLKSWVHPTNPGKKGNGNAATVDSSVSPNVPSAQFDANHVVWVLVRASHPLPIELLGFHGQCKGDSVEVDWSTASEINSAYFILEKSIDGLKYDSITAIEAAGNSNSVKNYSFNDTQINDVVVYYRFKQVDFDGKFEYSDVIALHCLETDPFSYLIYPNPVGNMLTISFTTNQSMNISYIIYDSKGAKVLNNNLSLINGVSKFYINTSGLAESVYMIQIYNTNSKLFASKFIKIK